MLLGRNVAKITLLNRTEDAFENSLLHGVSRKDTDKLNSHLATLIVTDFGLGKMQ